VEMVKKKNRNEQYSANIYVGRLFNKMNMKKIDYGFGAIDIL